MSVFMHLYVCECARLWLPLLHQSNLIAKQKTVLVPGCLPCGKLIANSGWIKGEQSGAMVRCVCVSEGTGKIAWAGDNNRAEQSNSMSINFINRKMRQRCLLIVHSCTHTSKQKHTHTRVNADLVFVVPYA